MTRTFFFTRLAVGLILCALWTSSFQQTFADGAVNGRAELRISFPTGAQASLSLGQDNAILELGREG